MAMLNATLSPDICLMVYRVGLNAHKTPVTPKATAVFQPNAREKISPLKA
jgi:hypothetical protein